MQNGFLCAATVLMLATGCGQLGGVCDDCPEAEGSAGTGGMAAVEPGVRPADAKPIPDGEIVIGYLPTWRGNLSSYATPDILSRLTHVALAFVTVDSAGVRFTDSNQVRAFVNAAHAYNVKVLMSIGGANDSHSVA